MAVLLAAKYFPQILFILVGAKRGNYYLRLYRVIDKWKLNNVTFLDPMPHNQLVELMRRCDILLHPSKLEGFPKVVLEGAATGLPAIIFDHYQAPAVLHDVTGFQVKTVDEMVDRLGLLIRDQSLRERMGAAAVDYAQQFDWNSIVRRWEEIFIHLASNKQSKKPS